MDEVALGILSQMRHAAINSGIHVSKKSRLFLKVGWSMSENSNLYPFSIRAAIRGRWSVMELISSNSASLIFPPVMQYVILVVSPALSKVEALPSCDLILNPSSGVMFVRKSWITMCMSALSFDGAFNLVHPILPINVSVPGISNARLPLFLIASNNDLDSSINLSIDIRTYSLPSSSITTMFCSVSGLYS